MRTIALVVCAAALAACGPRSDEAHVSADGGDAALEALSLSASGMGRVAFSETRAEGGAQVFQDVVMRVPVEDELIELRAQSLTIDNVRLDGEAPRFDEMVFRNVALAGDAPLTAERMVLSEPNAATAALVAHAFAMDPETEAPAALDDYAFRSVSLEGVSLESDEAAERLDIGEIRAEGLRGGVFETVMLDGVSLIAESEDGSLALYIDDMTLSGLDLGFLEAMEEAGDPTDPEALPAVMAANSLSDPYAKHYDAFLAEGIALSLNGVEMALSQLDARLEETSDGSLVTTNTFGPLTVTADPGGGPMGAQLAMALNFLGFGQGVEMSGVSRQVADRASDRIVMEQNQLTVKDAFTLDMTMDISGLAAYGANAERLAGAGASFDPSDVSDVFDPLMLNGLELRVRDDSLVERALQLASGFTGMPADELRAEAADMIAAQAEVAPEGPLREVAQEGVGALSAFIAEPGTLVVTLETGGEAYPVADLMRALEGEGEPLPLRFANEG